MDGKPVCNPRTLTDLWDGQEIGDPFLLRYDGRYYLYCSSHSHLPGIKCWISDDMISFKYCGFVCTDERTIGAYAPEVVYNAGRFWMVTSPQGSGHYLLVADNPLGPFTVVSDNLGAGIDGSIFVDDDGRSWFYRASAQGIRVHEMPSPSEIDVRSRTIPASYLGHWTEGPQVIKRNGRYFLTDTGNHVCSRGYHIEYMVSCEGPDRGYRRMSDGILLMETRDEYHGLGHSSTCIGPDMDTHYIIYHKNIIDQYNNPHHRSLCIDRLSFNGDRMYTNATWWGQSAPRQPLCASRDGKGMVHCSLGKALPLLAPDTYTAEVCFHLKQETGTVFFSNMVLTVKKDRTWFLTTGENGVFTENVDMDALLTLRICVSAGRMTLLINGMTMLQTSGEIRGGMIGIGGGCESSFIGFSDVAEGSHEWAESKPVPGCFDAVHTEFCGKLVAGEEGCRALSLQPGEKLKCLLNVLKTKPYHLAMTVKASAIPRTLLVNGERMTTEPSGAADKDGLEKCWYGMIDLQKGIQSFCLEATEPVVIDRIWLMEADEFAAANIIEGGNDITDGKLHVVGHKQNASMHRKYCGFTAAEVYGEAWYGGDGGNGVYWRDCAMHMVVRWKPCSPEACISAYIRSSKESWHPHQVSSSRFAYALHMKESGFYLTKQQYGETVVRHVELRPDWGSNLYLILRAAGSRITVENEDGVLMEYTDPMPLTAGRVGISANTDGLGFEKLWITENEL